MIKIDWKEKEEEIKTPFNKLLDGYYLLKSVCNGEVSILSICGGMGHFHEVNLDYSNDFPNFYDFYEIIGKIKNMRITDIELE